MYQGLNEIECKLTIISLLKNLKLREMIIIKERFGLTGDTDGTLRALAAKFGISKERVAQIQRSSIRKMRAAERGKRND